MNGGSEANVDTKDNVSELEEGSRKVWESAQ